MTEVKVLAARERRKLGEMMTDLVQAGIESRTRREPADQSARGQGGVHRSFERLRDLATKDGFRVMVMGPMKPQAEKIVSEVGLPIYNTAVRLPVRTWPEEWYVHFMHPRKGGHRLLAQNLAAEFDKLGWRTSVR